DEAGAVAYAHGAHEGGVARKEIHAALGRAALAHYADFGHSAIYVLKTAQLAERLPPEAELPLLVAMVRSLVSATREERLPEFRFYGKALAAWDGSGAESARTEDFTGLSIDAALKRTLRSSGRPTRELYDALVGAAAWNLLHFDTAFDQATGNAIADNV